MAESQRPPHDDERCQTGEQCFRCHIRGVNLGTPRDFPSRTPSKGAPRKHNNWYEKKIPVQTRPGGTVVPYLRKDGGIMYQKEFDSKKHAVADNRAKLEASNRSES